MNEYKLAESLLREAEQEQPRRVLEPFYDVIVTLRDDKKFTFREIADWLNSKTAMETDHNAVWRCYTKRMHPADAAAEGEQDEEIEREEAGF